jgi:hypothetical protein
MSYLVEIWLMGLYIKKALAVDRVRFVERGIASYSQTSIASLSREPFANALFTLHSMCVKPIFPSRNKFVNAIIEAPYKLSLLAKNVGLV